MKERDSACITGRDADIKKAEQAIDAEGVQLDESVSIFGIFSQDNSSGVAGCLSRDGSGERQQLGVVNDQE